MEKVRLVATDLDGTFLRNDRSISEENLRALTDLGDAGIIRVAATGRNLRKVKEVIPSGTPFDFIVFSSGAGIYHWTDGRFISGINISPASSALLSGFLMKRNLNFHAFFPVPDNHQLYFFRGGEHCEEFERYFSFHNSFAFPLQPDQPFPDGLCQYLIIIREDKSLFDQMKAEIESAFDEVRVIRSSSPITNGYIWMEVFNRKVSKGNGIIEICRLTDVHPDQTLSIGNDYNDIDMLEITAHSYITDNAPEEIKAHYLTIPSNEEHGFSHIVRQLIN